MIATFTVAPINGVSVPHGLVAGQPILIQGAFLVGQPSQDPNYNGLFLVSTVDPSSNSFSYQMVSVPAGNADPSRPAKLTSIWFTRDVVVENNTIEMIPSRDTATLFSIAIRVDSVPGSPFDTGQFKSFRNVSIRKNLVRYLPAPDGTPVPGNALDEAVLVTFAENATIENNLIDLANSTPMRQYLCGSVAYFNNRKASGQLILGLLQPASGSRIPQNDRVVSVIADAGTLGFL